MERSWTGRIRVGSAAEHERFVAWLSSADGRSLLSRSLLTEYRLVEEDGRLTIIFAADEPQVIIRFLRNRRFWPDFWEFDSADRTQVVTPSAGERISWRK